MSVLLASLLIAASARVQGVLPLDLSTPAANDTVIVTPRRYTIRISNRVPHFRYEVSVADRALPIAPLSLSLGDTTGLPNRGLVSSCGALTAAIDKMRDIEREEDIPSAVAELTGAMRQDGEARCRQSYRYANSLRDSTVISFREVFDLKPGRYLTVVVTRLGAPGNPVRIWRRVFSTGPRGEWRVTYGFSFPIVSNFLGLNAAERFVARQADSNRFVIARERRTSPLQVAPSVFFSFMPVEERGITVNWLTAGLGVDLTDPIICLGTGITYNSNLQLSAGVLLSREPALRGKYSDGDTIPLNLSFDELHERVFQFRPYFSLTMRFKSSPFKKTAARRSQSAVAERLSDERPSGRANWPSR